MSCAGSEGHSNSAQDFPALPSRDTLHAEEEEAVHAEASFWSSMYVYVATDIAAVNCSGVVLDTIEYRSCTG